MENVIKYFTDKGWEQSHSETENGFIFEKWDDNELCIISTNAKGCQVASVRMNRAAVNSGVAGAVVLKLYEDLVK